MANVRFEQATRMFRGAQVPAVDRLDLELEDGELLVLVGPSGSGKSTALRMLAGLEEVDGGAVYIGERDVTDVPPKRRDIAMVFQNYALYPYLDVRANIGFPLKVAGVRKAERDRRVCKAAEMLGLTPLLDRKPAQLSGGERQRAAMGRAIVREPRVFLMDEPLSNLDAKLRVKMRVDIAALQRQLGVTTLYVTHDQVEAMTMGHRVAVLRDGQLQQCGPPRELYSAPANVFVAGFIGSPAMNLCPARLNGDGVADLCGVKVPLPRDAVSAAGARGLKDVVIGLRPESLELGGSEGIPAEVEVVEELGADAYAFCVARDGALGDGALGDGAPGNGALGDGALEGGTGTKLIARTDYRRPPEPGTRVALMPRAGEAHVFDAATGERLGG